jgi:hypothetical protein
MTSEAIMGPVPPCEILLEEFLVPLGVSQYKLAKAITRCASRSMHRSRAERPDRQRPADLHQNDAGVLAAPAGSRRPDPANARPPGHLLRRCRGCPRAIGRTTPKSRRLFPQAPIPCEWLPGPWWA